MNTQAHVICCNDSVEAVCLGSEDEAKAHLEVLAKKRFEKEHNQFSSEAEMYELDSYMYYRDVCFWHIHTVPLYL